MDDRSTRLALASFPATTHPLSSNVSICRSFLGQTPLFLTAIVCCILVIPNTKTASANAEDAEVKGNSIAQMDFAGALLLGVSILTLMLPLELGGTKLPWTHPVIAILFVSAVSLLCLFLAVELWWARNPIVPVRLLKNREVLASYAISALMGVAQFGVSARLLAVISIMAWHDTGLISQFEIRFSISYHFISK